MKDLPGMNIKFGPGGINKKEYPDAPIGTEIEKMLKIQL